MAMAQGEQRQPRQVIIPGQGGIDVELLNRKTDLNQDISLLTVTELRVLRNSFWAREGFPFRDAFLRGVFQCTSWYDSLQWKRWEKLEADIRYDDDRGYRNAYYEADQRHPIKITPAEQTFVNRLLERERELLHNNFKPTKDAWQVNMDNVVNAMQLEHFDPALHDRLGAQGFAIVPARHQQLFHLYEQNDYSDFPSFVTTDLYLQLYHLYFDCLLRDIEQHSLFNVVGKLCDRGLQLTGKGSSTEIKRLRIFFNVARCLLNGEKGNGTVADEVARATAAVNATSNYLGYQDFEFPYALFRPRGHYTRNDSLSQYFRAMMWLQTVPFGTDKPEQLQAAVVLAELTVGDAVMSRLYEKLYEPMTWLFGTPDNITITQVGRRMQQMGVTAKQVIRSKKLLKELRQWIEATSEHQTRLRPKYEHTSRHKINLIPQRYTPDAEVMLEMVDYDGQPTRRATPQGLDIMAALGVASAERILKEEQQEGQRWGGFGMALERMKQQMTHTDWKRSVGNRWIDALKSVCDTCKGYPYFMLTDAWQRKELNAALASWAELKHDAILYAKQPMGAECGGGGPPPPVVKGYVEPNLKFWHKAISLLQTTCDVLNRFGLTTEKSKQSTERLLEEAEFMLHASEKELAGLRLSEDEYDHLKCIGATFENISLDLVREPDMYLMGWDDVQGTDRKVALIADVYTANADNNPHKSVVYAAVGLADELYTVVEVEGYLWLMRGAVLSYREMQRPVNMPRMNDEEWQRLLEGNPDEGRPQWMQPVMVPTKQAPKADERYFYSTGC